MAMLRFIFLTLTFIVTVKSSIFSISSISWTSFILNIIFTLYQVADFGVSAQLTRTISRRKVLTLLCQ